MVLGRPERGWCHDDIYSLSALLVAVTRRKPFPASPASADAFHCLLCSLPQPAPCLAVVSWQDWQLLPPAGSYTAGWTPGVADGPAARSPLSTCWNRGLSSGDCCRDLSSWKLLAIFLLYPTKGEWEGATPGLPSVQRRNTESWVSFCVLVLVSWRSLSLQISHFRLCAPCLWATWNYSSIWSSKLILPKITDSQYLRGCNLNDYH